MMFSAIIVFIFIESATSPSTSVATRRSSRRSSMTKESRESSASTIKPEAPKMGKKPAVDKTAKAEEEGTSEKEVYYLALYSLNLFIMTFFFFFFEGTHQAREG